MCRRAASIAPRSNRGAAYERMLLYLSPEFLRRSSTEEAPLETCFLQAAEDFRFVVRTGARNASLLEPLRALERAKQSPGFGQQMLERALLYQLLIALTRGMQEQALPFASASAVDEKIAAILQYLASHLTEKISIDDLAARFYISKYHMMRRFRAQTGYTIHAYLVGKRLMLAREKISAGVPVMEAACPVRLRRLLLVFQSLPPRVRSRTQQRPLSGRKKKRAEKSEKHLTDRGSYVTIFRLIMSVRLRV